MSQLHGAHPGIPADDPRDLRDYPECVIRAELVVTVLDNEGLPQSEVRLFAGESTGFLYDPRQSLDAQLTEALEGPVADAADMLTVHAMRAVFGR